MTDRTASDRTADWVMVNNDFWVVYFDFNDETVYFCQMNDFDDVLNAAANWQNDGVLPG